MDHHHHIISSAHLTPSEVIAAVRGGYTLSLSEEAKAAIEKCRAYLDRKAVESPVPIYGVTTGFGSLCNISIEKEDLSALQKNLVMSHACGTGEEVPEEIVRIMIMLKVQSLSYGHSGVQLATVERLIDMFNHHYTPVVYQQGSLGASGDLAPLAHLSLPLLGLGEVRTAEGERISGEEMNSREGWAPLTLQSKEGLALLNGTQFMAAYGVWSLDKARRLSDWADVVGAMSLEAFDGRIDPFADNVHQVRPHAGQIATASGCGEYC